MDDGDHRPPPADGTAKAAGEPRGGLDRRRFLGAAAAGAAGIATAATACDTGPGGPPTTAPRRDRTGAGETSAAAERAERDRPGDADWRITSQGPPDAVEGYTDRTAVPPGGAFGLHVSTTAPGFTVSAYRIGWYGGARARLVWRSDRLPGRRAPAARFLPDTRTVRADWPRTTTVRTDGWPPGAYLLRLDADHGHQRYIPLVVRSPSAEGRTVVMHAVATWQAYNTWGGYDLYRGRDGSYGSRAYAVSFDRPYNADGAEKFLAYERALVVLAERLGIPLAYTTGLDVHRDPDALRGARALLSLGHDEYWTPEQRQRVTGARDAGTNLAFLGANCCYRRIRPEEGPPGELRTVVCYKTDYRRDPYLASHPRFPTNDFRQDPAPDPESRLVGVLYEGFPVDAPYVVHSPDHWLFEGTGVRRGDRFDHLVGVEYDRVMTDMPTPRPLEILAHSPLVCRGRPSHADSSYYTAPSGAGVFSSGTMRWVEGLMAGTTENGRNHAMDARTGAFTTRTTENLLRAFAEGPAATVRPHPRDNVATLYPA
ncbi:N,N-dimethylformamidase beta subunit family domain-containing protein [Streptomyces tsukubensis]|uniref:N,N-dimethylformamidase beta subunit family domain-containing protein n=1 Tax=Streptomyces tsukubensis TaxID=83656 RepID=UPI00164E6E15|nr:N,N-dimethylformamidase beta subunit family domain-containing protein [Streptomyces tsukubensis]